MDLKSSSTFDRIVIWDIESPLSGPDMCHPGREVIDYLARAIPDVPPPIGAFISHVDDINAYIRLRFKSMSHANTWMDALKNIQSNPDHLMWGYIHVFNPDPNDAIVRTGQSQK